MILASLFLNIIVLVPVCFALIINAEKVQRTAGTFTPARGVLLAMYLTILVASLILLFVNEPKLVFSLLVMQIMYKFISPFTVKTLNNPIVISNLLIAAFHLFTVYVMFNSGSLF